MRTAVVIAPHPDDEVLGCTAVITSQPSTVVHVTDGVPPWLGDPESSDLRERRRSECEGAWKVLGATIAEVVACGAADLSVWQHVEPLAAELLAILETRPAADVYVPAFQRGHPDHDAVHVAAQLARLELTHRGALADRRWISYALYGLDQSAATRFGWLWPGQEGVGAATTSSPEALSRKGRALEMHGSQIRPGSVLQRWLASPGPERFAPLADPDVPLPTPPSYYERELDFASRGIPVDRIDASLRSTLGAALGAAMEVGQSGGGPALNHSSSRPSGSPV